LGERFKIVVVYRFLAAKIRAELSDYETKSDQYSVALDAVTVESYDPHSTERKLSGFSLN